jgi:hypothetical protein
MTRAERVTMIARDRADLSVRRQCALIGLARSGVYREPPSVVSWCLFALH